MYGIKHNLTSLPPMPIDGDTWSVMHSWVLPTRSFLEFVMFSRSGVFEFFISNFFLSLSLDHQISPTPKQRKRQSLEFVNNVNVLICRMFVDTLDSEFYEQHHLSGVCYLSLSKVSLLRGYMECWSFT